MANLFLYQHALWQLQEVVVTASCHIVMQLRQLVSHVNTISSIYMDLSTYYILTVQKKSVGILSSIPNLITLPTCLCISLTTNMK
jgi:hypothetical protein